MGFLDSILGRSTPPPADLDVLFALPQAAISLQAEGFAFTGTGSVCYRDVEGTADDLAADEAQKLVALDSAASVARTDDRFGFRWITVTRAESDVTGVVTDLHAVNTNLVDAGFSAALLCSTVVFTAPSGGPLALVYLFKRGTVYPFAPAGEQRRDNALELQVRGVIADDVPVEPELGRWLAIWGAPGT